VSRDIRAAIVGGRLIALTAVIGSGKTILSRRLRIDLEREGRVIVSRSLSVDKAKITVPLLIAALFYDLSPEKAVVTISSQSERRERDLQELFRRAKKPVALFIDDAHELHPKTLIALKRLIELVTEGGGQLSIVLIGHPKLKNDLRRPKMEEIGDRTTVFEFGGLRDRQRDYIDWVLKASLDEYVVPGDVSPTRRRRYSRPSSRRRCRSASISCALSRLDSKSERSRSMPASSRRPSPVN
jgi:type II secretory pathway predicted ATPase ExeA